MVVAVVVWSVGRGVSGMVGVGGVGRVARVGGEEGGRERGQGEGRRRGWDGRKGGALHRVARKYQNPRTLPAKKT